MKTRFNFILFTVICLLSLSAGAQGKNFTFDAEMKTVAASLFSLKLDDAEKKLDSYIAAHPGDENLMPYLFKEYALFYRAFFTGEQQHISSYEKKSDALLKKLYSGNKKNEWYRYAVAEVMLHRSLMFANQGAYVRAATNTKDAYNLIKDNLKDHPNFLPQYKTMGTLELIAASVPASYQWLSNLAGFKGDLSAGKDKLSKITRNLVFDDYLKATTPEILFIYAFVYQNVLKAPDKAWQIIDVYTKDYSTNLLNCYTRAYNAIKLKKNDEAITILSSKPKGAEFVKFPYMDYLLGNVYLYKQKYPEASKHYNAFLGVKSSGNYVKSAMLRMAWISLFTNKKTDAEAWYKKILADKSESKLDDDKQATREATERIEVTGLIKARLSFDGGYYTEAINEINKVNQASLTGRAKLDFLYRKARILHEMKNWTEAENAYQKVCTEGKESAYFYAAYSSYYLGVLQEERFMYQLAKFYYESVTDYPTKEYKTDIERKAKAALERLK